jgi:hypothetical protein
MLQCLELGEYLFNTEDKIVLNRTMQQVGSQRALRATGMDWALI